MRQTFEVFAGVGILALPVMLSAGESAPVFADGFEGDGVVVACAAIAPQPVPGRCEVTAGSEFLLIRSHLATPDTLFENGEMLIDGSGVIQCAGCACSDSTGYAGATVLNCPEVLATPGLINSHDHLTFQSPKAEHGAERFDHRHDWRTGQRQHSELSFPSDRSSEAQTWGEIRQLIGGATSVIGAGSAAGFLRNLDRSTDRDGLPGPSVDTDTFPLGDSRGDLLASGCDYPSDPSPRPGDVYSLHVAEGVDLEARNEWLCIASSLNLPEPGLPGPSLVHATALGAEDVEGLKAADATVVWSPRSDISLYGMTSPVSLFASQGINLALGTNWAATGSSSMLRELACAGTYNDSALSGYFSDQDLLIMATRAAARAAGVAGIVGALEAGLTADITMFDASSNAGFSAATKAGVADIVLMLKGGVPLFGDGAVVEGLGFGDGQCELMGSVVPGDCLSDRRLCVTREGSADGFTYAGLAASSQGLEPIYRCEYTPADERSCLPARDEGDGIAYSGQPGAGDADGDGVADASDNCPSTFNPPRPVDGFVQADSDGDGTGDLCDPEP